MAGAGALEPRISVIIPMRDAAGTLVDELEALTRQTYTGWWEVILADNGSVDASRELGRGYEGRLPNLRVISVADRPGCGHARNEAAKVASGDLLAFCDADDIVSPDWLAELASAWTDDALVGGQLDFRTLNVHDWPIIVDQDHLEVHLNFMVAAPGGNLAISRAAFEQLAGFNESYLYGEDVDFSWRAQLAGYPVVYARGAVIALRMKETVRALLKQVYKVGKIDACLYRDFRDRGLRRDPVLPLLKTTAWLGLNAVGVFRSAESRVRWLQWLAYRAGRLSGSLTYRVVFP